MNGKRVSHWSGLAAGVAAAAVLTAATHSADARAPLPARMQPVLVDSGAKPNPTGAAQLVFREVVDLGPDVPWVRVLFDREGTQLAPGSFIRVTSMLDGETHILDAEELQNWGYGTAFFNGSIVEVELIAGRNTVGNALRIQEVFAGERPALVAVAGVDDDDDIIGGVARICDGADTRAPDSTTKGIGRLLRGNERDPGLDDAGSQLGHCTAFIIDKIPAGAENTERLHLTAGHCFGHRPRGLKQNEAYILQFNVPASDADCVIRHPTPECQFPVVPGSVTSLLKSEFTGLIGADSKRITGIYKEDFAVFRTEKSGDPLRTSYEHQDNNAFPLAAALPQVNAPVSVKGFGTDTGDGNQACDFPCQQNNGANNATLQTADGKFLGTFIEPFDLTPLIKHDADDCGGNSGSPILHNGEIIGIATFGIPCASVGDNGNHNGGIPITDGSLQGVINCKADGSGLVLLGLGEPICALDEAVPAVSDWGLVVIALVTLVCGTIVLRNATRNWRLETRN